MDAEEKPAVHNAEEKPHHSEEKQHLAHAHAGHQNPAGKAVSFVTGHKIYVLAAVIYLIIALVNFWPITAHIASTVAGVGGDAYQSLWNIWFVGFSLFNLHQGIWHTTLLFWPIGASLIYETSTPIASLLATPLTAVSLPFAYNMIFFAGFCLSGLAMFILAKYLTKNSYAAFIAGLIFTFSSFHIAQAYGHLEYTNLEWVPLALYFFLRTLREDHRRQWKAFAVAVCMVLACFTLDIEVGIVLILLFIIISIVYLLGKETRKRVVSMSFLKALIVFVIATFILGSWAWIPIAGSVLHSGLGSLGTLSDVGHSAVWSDDLLSYFIPTPYNGLLGGLFAKYAYIYHGGIAETASYVTYTAIVLALIGLWKHFKENRLWLGLGIIFFLLALGPVLLVNSTLPLTIGSNTQIPGIPMPYQLYKMIPFFNTVREPGRLDLMVTVAIAVMAAFGVKVLTERKEPHHQPMPHIDMRALGIAALIAILFLVESGGMPLSTTAAAAVTTHVSIPKVYSELSQIKGNFSVLQLPIIGTPTFPELYAGEAMYYQTASHKPIIGGYTTRENDTQLLMPYQIPVALQATSLIDYGQAIYQSPVDGNYTNQTLLSLYNYDVAFVAVDKTAYNQSEFNQLAGYLYSFLGNPVYNDNTTTVFQAQNAIDNALYRSYVAYPVLADWEQNVSFINGNYIQEWIPTGAGAISVFAPYRNQSNLYNTLTHGQAYYINSTIDVYASSPTPQKLYLAEVTGPSNYTVIGSANLTQQFQGYSFKTVMVSGPIGNTYLFMAQYTNNPITILNVSFARGG